MFLTKEISQWAISVKLQYGSVNFGIGSLQLGSKVQSLTVAFTQLCSRSDKFAMVHRKHLTGKEKVYSVTSNNYLS